VLGLAACGQDDEETLGDASLQAPVPVRVASGAQGAGRAASPALGETADMSIAPWVSYDYVLGDGLPDLADEANGWQYVGDVEPDPEQVLAIAAALGVEGELVAQPDDMGGGWIIGPNDGSAAALYVSRDGQLNWYYSMPYALGGVGTAASGTACAEPVLVEPTTDVPADTAGGVTGDVGVPPMPPDVATEPCVVEEPQPPAGILTEDEARARVLALFDAMGVDPAGFELEVYADEWYASVTAYQLLGGTRSPVAWYFGFGAEGRLESASGVLATPVEVGPYPLVSFDDAVARLADQQFGYGPLLRGGVADTGVAVGAEPASAVGAPVPVECDPAADCIPGDSVPAPETITVTLVDARMDLWWTWDVDGTVWLLPAYTFTDSEGGLHTVAAVTDEYLVVEEPGVEPLPVETGAPMPPPGTDVFVEPKPGIEDSVPTNTIRNPDDGGVAVISDAMAATLTGLGEGEAAALAETNQWEFRVVERDGELLAGTADYRTDRVNVVVTDGIVTSVFVG
jgi:hypothetical protein